MENEAIYPAGAIDAPQKPRLRGVLHQGAALVALGAGAVLVALVPEEARAACAIYALSMVVLFSVSATYHRVTWQPRARAWMKRLDHSCIFLLIAGTYTPLGALGLPEEARAPFLAAVWIGAGAGVLQSLFWSHAPKYVTVPLYVALGWLVLWYYPAFREGLSQGQRALLFFGGGVYTLGGLAYGLKRPDPWPRVFGYHEVFHALTLIAGVIHFAMVISVARGAGCVPP